jgi:hypothetical protein
VRIEKNRIGASFPFFKQFFSGDVSSLMGAGFRPENLPNGLGLHR